jgi:transcription antitermination factor NusG
MAAASFNLVDPSVWLLCRTEPRQERNAKWNVEKNSNAEAYLPVFLDPTNGKIFPLFPNYLFVKVGDGIWGFLKRTVGIFRVVMRGIQPDSMPNSIMEKLKEREYEGLVRLQKFEPGQKVEINGWNGIYLGMKSKDRCRILMTMFGREVETDVTLSNLQPYRG